RIPNELSPQQKSNLRADFEKMQSGVENTGRIALLSGGLEWVPMSVTPEQAQMIDSLKYHREQVAAVYNLPPHKLGAMENSAVRANIEEQNRSYVQGTLMPLATAFEQECMQKLCSAREMARGSCSVRHNFKALLRADQKTRYESYATGRQWGWLNVNTILDLEDMDEIGPQGDVYLAPSNMVPADQLGKEPEPPPAPPELEEEEEETEQLPAIASSTTAALTTAQWDHQRHAVLELEKSRTGLKAYAKRTLRDKQRIEIDNLRRGIHGKEPFDAFCSSYYARFAAQLIEPLEPLTTVCGFVDDQQLQQLVGDYVSTSYRMVHATATPAELMDVIVYFPARIDALLDQLTEEG
ncbi:MAG: phage portal protein, partial [Deltaproteobacteria bacterium]|nr:phage portal protein [Deltaproteobacteria bacterium]